MRKFSLELNDDGQGVLTEYVIEGIDHRVWYFEFKERKDLFRNMFDAKLENAPVSYYDGEFEGTRCLFFERDDSYFKAIDVATEETYVCNQKQAWAYTLAIAYETLYER